MVTAPLPSHTEKKKYIVKDEEREFRKNPRACVMSLMTETGKVTRKGFGSNVHKKRLFVPNYL